MSKGFTILEILVVIGIIAILSVLGITAYQQGRSRITLDLQTDSLIALLHSFREESRQKPICIGMRFSINKAPIRVERKYRKGCELDKDEEKTINLSSMQDVEITKIWLDQEESHPISQFFFLFLPPDGRLWFSSEANRLNIQMSLKSSLGLTKRISINRITGVIEKL